ncbi:NAD(P)-dependent oxidoreductase [Microcella alkaliphila]|uniref:NAD(P)-dependent oxidoreductase n=1 Tax=Microcella alkaliphila TaxID=279828 RepID=UPI0018D57085|nr:NAD(P)-dependent oxidoreductase [Microcella alkaliphila]
MTHVAWTQWDDLEVPAGVELLNPSSAPLDSADLGSVTFYVPPYMTGLAGLEPVTRMPKLAHLQLPNAGSDDAVPFAREGLTIHNARGVHDISTAELALALTLASNRGFDDFHRAQAQGAWRPKRYQSLWRARVGIIGFGSIGRTIARLMEPFEAEIVPFTARGRDGTRTLAELPELLPTLDVVILILPAKPSTIGLVDATFLSAMKDGALLVNVARGPIVVTQDLIDELATGRIRAAVDVTDPEPLPDGHRLWAAPNLIISPHVGGNSSAFEPRMRRLIYDQLKKLVDGEPLDHAVIVGREILD